MIKHSSRCLACNSSLEMASYLTSICGVSTALKPAIDAGGNLFKDVTVGPYQDLISDLNEFN